MHVMKLPVNSNSDRIPANYALMKFPLIFKKKMHTCMSFNRRCKFQSQFENKFYFYLSISKF